MKRVKKLQLFLFTYTLQWCDYKSYPQKIAFTACDKNTTLILNCHLSGVQMQEVIMVFLLIMAWTGAHLEFAGESVIAMERTFHAHFMKVD